MKGFIKITDTRNKLHYLNVDYIIKIGATNEGHAGNSFIYVTSGQSVATYQTNSSPEEIIQMIDEAKS